MERRVFRKHIEVLEAGAVREITAYVTPSEDAMSGDYALTFSVKNTEASDSEDFRVTVKTETVWGFVGLGLIAEAGNTILNPSVRSIEIVTMESYSGAVSGYLSFGQSLLLVWPHLALMAVLAMVGFMAAYLSFMQQEIRT